MRYELAENQAGDHHHHHLICKVCQRVEPVDACAVSKLEKNIVAEYGYADVSHRLEFFGVCPQCQK
jgi:Fur family ferric uptake transcriptional regulator